MMGDMGGRLGLGVVGGGGGVRVVAGWGRRGRDGRGKGRRAGGYEEVGLGGLNIFVDTHFVFFCFFVEIGTK